MIRLNFNKWIVFLILSSPVIDLINGAIIFLTNYNGVSIGQASRIILLIFNMFIIYKISKKQFFIMIMLFLFIGIQMFLGILSEDLNSMNAFFSEMIFNIKFIYNISIIVLISTSFKKNIISRNELIRYTVKSIVFICAMIIVTTLLNLNIGSYGDNTGSRGLFTDINALTSSIIVGLGFQLNVYFRKVMDIKEFIKTATILSAAFLVGTKAAMVFSIILLIYFLIREIFSRKLFNSIGAITVGILIVSIIIYYFTYGNGIFILNRLGYFRENLDLFSFLLSGRNQTLINIFPYWKSSMKNILIGTGYINGSNSIKYLINGRGIIEMDFFDIYYFWGIILGSVVLIKVIGVLFKSIKSFIITKNYNTRVENIIYIIIVICTFLGGHVLFSPLASVYFAIVYSLNKYKKKGIIDE